jgi:hypothetical protein
MLLGNTLAACHPVIDKRVVFFQQLLELTQLFSGEGREVLIGKGPEQQICLAGAAVPRVERELAPQRLDRAAVVQDWRGASVGYLFNRHEFDPDPLTIWKPLQSAAFGHQALGIGNRTRRVEPLWAGVGAVHDGVAAIETKRVVEPVESLADALVAAVGNPTVRLEQN